MRLDPEPNGHHDTNFVNCPGICCASRQVGDERIIPRDDVLVDCHLGCKNFSAPAKKSMTEGRYHCIWVLHGGRTIPTLDRAWDDCPVGFHPILPDLEPELEAKRETRHEA